MSYLKNIAVVGVASSAGKFAIAELLKAGRHTITALTRPDSTNPVPPGVKVAKVDYDDHAGLVAALQGQDALFINLSVASPQDTQDKLLRAAAAANVPWILPNEWSADLANEKFGEETFLGPPRLAARRQIEAAGQAWIGITSSFWYEFSLAGGANCFGIDVPRRRVEFIDDGATRINVSTWPQCGRAVAALLSLKLRPDGDDDTSLTLESFRNKPFFFSSFLVSQRDMFASVLRVTATTEADWAVTHEDAQQRWRDGVDAMQKGDRAGFAKAMYTRVFYPDGEGDYESKYGLANEGLGLPQEDLDEATRAGVDMALTTKQY